ncbi:hypothetical protein Sfulv_22780 [Streptomyces fulvorobeus]|uniref:Uncharacterized protein n=1 Tax=Streptomyces fulvorobeus TaxID=284028 RepID=A0A7J0C5N7_9ACTN|nr:hypothetical protein Sfulv_22780 [Streptomyces fulvorobeus]
MLGSLESTGSDLATGNVWRLTERGRQQAWQYRWLTATRTRTHITRDPRLLADRVAWNKVFRRSFWDRHAFTFPEGRLYEDTPVMIPAHYLAGSVDVLHEHVYHWRVREGSITRRRTDVTGVRDRIAACEQVSAFLAGRDEAQRRRYDVSCLRDDFLYFLEGMTLGSAAYRTAFMAGAGAFLDRAGSSVLDGLPVELRVKWRLVRERRLDDLLAVLALERTNGPGVFTVEGLPGRRRAGHPGVAHGDSRLGRSDLPAAARLSAATWRTDGRLGLRGYAYIRNLPADTTLHALKWGVLRAAEGRQLRKVPVRSVTAPEATVNSGQELHSYDRAGFEMVIDPRTLRPGRWLVGMVVSSHGVLRRAAVRALDAASAQPLVHDLDAGRRAVLGYRDGRLELAVTRLPALAQAHDGGTGILRLTGQLYGGARPQALSLTLEGTEEERTCPVECGEDGRFAVRIPLAELAAVPPPPHRAPREVEPEGGARWRGLLLFPGGSRVPLAAAPDLPPPATACPAGELVVDLTGEPVVDGARWTAEGGLCVEGTGGGTGGDLVLRHEALRETATVAVTRREGRFAARVPPGSSPKSSRRAAGTCGSTAVPYGARRRSSPGSRCTGRTEAANWPWSGVTATGWPCTRAPPCRSPTGARTAGACCAPPTTRRSGPSRCATPSCTRAATPLGPSTPNSCGAAPTPSTSGSPRGARGGRRTSRRRRSPSSSTAPPGTRRWRGPGAS